MTDINADMTASQSYIPLAAGDAVDLAPGYYLLDSEYIDVQAPRSAYGPYGIGQNPGAFDGRSCVRGIGGSTAATHSSGATLTRYYPDSPSGFLGTLPEVPATPSEQDIVDALVTLGLVTQAVA